MLAITIILTIILSLIGLAAIILLACAFSDWKEMFLVENAPFISYKLLKTAYDINPERWFIDRYDIHYDEGKFSYYVNLHFFDWLRLNFDLKYTEKQKNKQITDKKLERLLSVIQKDIETEINKSKKEVETANKMMEEQINKSKKI